MRKPLFLIRTYIVMYSLNHVDVNAVIIPRYVVGELRLYVCMYR